MAKSIEYTQYLKNGDIVLTYNKKNLFSRLIAKCSKVKGNDFKASHAILVLSTDFGLMAESAFPGGVKIKKYHRYKKGKNVVYILRIKDFSNEQYQLLVKSAVEKEGLKYSLLQVFALLIKYIFKVKAIGDVSKRAMVCSEYVSQIFKDSTMDLFPGFSSVNVSPQMFFTCPRLFLIKILE